MSTEQRETIVGTPVPEVLRSGELLELAAKNSAL